MSARPVRVGLFDGLTEQDSAELTGRLPSRSFAAGETLLAQGYPPADIYLVTSGVADVWKADGHGVRHLGRVDAGGTCGELSVLTGNPVTSSVTARTPLTALVLNRAAFADATERFPQIYRNIGAIVAERFVRAEERAGGSPDGRSFCAVDYGVAPLASLALACSVAWHTQRPTVLLVDESDPREWIGELPVSSDLQSSGDNHREVRASVARCGQHDRADAIHRLNLSGTNTLCLCEPDRPRTRSVDQLVHLLPTDVSLADQVGHATSIHLWADEAMRLAGHHWIPRPSEQDIAAVRRGLMADNSPAASALGKATREMCGLRVGLALGEGSAKGYAHFGVLRSLERFGVPCDAIAGTSIGAAVAGLYAAGLPIDEAQAQLARVGSATFRPVVPRSSLMSHAGVARIMRQVWGERRIEDLSIALAVVAADIVTGREVVLKRGLLWAAALASVSIPGIYPPQRMGDRLLVDGGVVDPVPTRVVRALGSDLVIAVRLTTRSAARVEDAEAVAPSGKLPSAIYTLMRARELMQGRDRTSEVEADVLIEPDFPSNPGRGLRDFSQGQRFVEIGEEAAERAIPHIAAVLPWVGCVTE